MPELPEVETIRRSLAEWIIGQTIGRVWIKKNSRLLRNTVSAQVLKKKLTGRTIRALERRGKYLVFLLDQGHRLVIHLGMTGKLFRLAPHSPSPPHIHLRLALGKHHLLLQDPRTFGRIFWLPAGKLPDPSPLSRLGPEPLDEKTTAEYLAEKTAGRGCALKALLLDQTVLAGVGNIYADEACFQAGLSPFRPAGSLRPEEWETLLRALRSVLRAAIRGKGTTVRNYEWEHGKTGGFQKRLRVYGKAGGRCPACGQEIRRAVVAGRSTSFCPRCQK